MKLLIFLFIRPSGNPINVKRFEPIISSDIVQEKGEINKFHRLDVLSKNIINYIFTIGSKFTHKGET